MELTIRIGNISGMAKKQPLKSGEKILLGIFGAFFCLAAIGYVVLESVRLTSEKPMFTQTTFFNFSKEGKIGHGYYMKANCNACHRAVRSGTSMGLSLDGIGSKRSVDWLEQFLLEPERVYEGPTIDHGVGKEAGNIIARLSEDQIRPIAVFLSELKAVAGSSVSKVPPPERSEFIDGMVGAWAPEGWKEKYEDVRDRIKREEAESADGDVTNEEVIDAR